MMTGTAVVSIARRDNAARDQGSTHATTTRKLISPADIADERSAPVIFEYRRGALHGVDPGPPFPPRAPARRSTLQSSGESHKSHGQLPEESDTLFEPPEDRSPPSPPPATRPESAAGASPRPLARTARWASRRRICSSAQLTGRVEKRSRCGDKVIREADRDQKRLCGRNFPVFGLCRELNETRRECWQETRPARPRAATRISSGKTTSCFVLAENGKSSA